MISITYNGLDLNDGINYWVEELAHEATAKPEINVQKIARSNDSVILKKGYGIKIIKMAVIIQGSSVAALDTLIDDFKQKIEDIEKNLDIEYDGGTRRYVCTGYIDTDPERKPRWARAQVRFECYRAFGEDTASTTENFNGKTTNPYTDDIDIEGNAPAKPDITITLNSLTGTGLKYIQLKNKDTGDYIRVSKNGWQANDIISIYSDRSTVLVNGTVTQYLGIMPIWEPGVNNWEYSDDLTARNVNISFGYKKKWL